MQLIPIEWNHAVVMWNGMWNGNASKRKFGFTCVVSITISTKIVMIIYQTDSDKILVLFMLNWLS